MFDPRLTEVAKILVDYSAKVQKGDKVYLHSSYLALPLAQEVYRRVIRLGAFPRVQLSAPEFEYILAKEGSDEQLQYVPESLMQAFQECQVYIGLGASLNGRMMSNVDFHKVGLRDKALLPILNYRVNRMRWVIARYPTPTMAHDAFMADDEFADFYFDAMIQDWEKQNEIQDKIKARLEKADKVQILGHNTDLTFSIKNRPATKCVGQYNMPDGEIFCAPWENSTEGYIEFTYPALENGAEFPGVYLEFSQGRVVKAVTTGNQQQFDQLLATDEGAKVFGEFGIGTNYQINKFTRNTLFDEKIGGTIHLALGNAYEESLGTNSSAIHVDIVKDLRDNGKILLDGVALQENGVFKF